MSVTEDKVLSIVIPCYNEKDNILNIVKLVQASPIPNKEIIVAVSLHRLFRGDR